MNERYNRIQKVQIFIAFTRYPMLYDPNGVAPNRATLSYKHLMPSGF